MKWLCVSVILGQKDILVNQQGSENVARSIARACETLALMLVPKRKRTPVVDSGTVYSKQ